MAAEGPSTWELSRRVDELRGDVHDLRVEMHALEERVVPADVYAADRRALDQRFDTIDTGLASLNSSILNMANAQTASVEQARQNRKFWLTVAIMLVGVLATVATIIPLLVHR